MRARGLVVGLLAAAPFAVPAQAIPLWEITRWTVDGGGGASQAGAYSVEGTLGQTDAGVQTGGNYALYGGFWLGGTSRVDAPIPGETIVDRLELAVYPNPVSSRTRLRYALPARGLVRIGLFDLAGRCVERLVDGVEEAGLHQRDWARSRASLPPGVYLVRLEVPGDSRTRKVLLGP